jgi:hypothetical protein
METDMSRLRSTLVVALIGAICMAAAVPREASPQPDPAAKVHVESLEVNLTLHPAFQFVVAIPTAMRFEAFEDNGRPLSPHLGILQSRLARRPDPASRALSRHQAWHLHAAIRPS